MVDQIQKTLEDAWSKRFAKKKAPEVRVDPDKRLNDAWERSARTAMNKEASASARESAAKSAGRKYLLGLLGRAAGVAGVAVTAYNMYQSKKEADKFASDYKQKAMQIAKASERLSKSPTDERGRNTMVSGRKVKVKDAKKPASKPEAKKEEAKKPEMSFGQAFAAARKAGKDEFTFKGKRYHTRTKEEEEKRKATKKRQDAAARRASRSRERGPNRIRQGLRSPRQEMINRTLAEK